ncbi:reverse transcriptase family protein [Priestia megaterium]|uniref:reverse transcriptase family protein n=1 Tax=Priestia megaterium TaxID=1404 RepID=UPI00203B27AF|nr:reverse transcriptase family protein [Priestia megaterium]MCM3196830.1 reverse transcriptase family protein [Priestia megaterium]
MQIFIYKEEYFYDKILSSSKALIEETIKDKDKFYREKKIPKKNGDRTLFCLKKDCPLSKMQQNIRMNFLNKISIPDYVYGFVPNHSYKDFLFPHTNKKYYIRLDIKNFFDSINSEILSEIFSYYFQVKDVVNDVLLHQFIELVTLNDRVPQGAITSPIISNIIFRQLDLRIRKYCAKFNITYTRYADDLLFSSDNPYLHKDFFIKKIKYIVSTKGFQLNKGKVRYDKDFISLNGFVVEKNIRLSRKKLKNISNTLFILERYKNKFNLNIVLAEINKMQLKKEISSISELINYLAGYRSFLIQLLDKDNLENFENEKFLKYINRIQTAIIFLDSQ